MLWRRLQPTHASAARSSRRALTRCMQRRAAAGAGTMLVWTIALSTPAIAQAPGSNEYGRAEVLVRNHDWDGAIRAVDQLLQSGPKTPKVFNLIGLAYTGKGDLAQADHYFRAALELEPAFLPALKNLGINEVSLGSATQARVHLEAAALLAPGDPVVNLYLGEMAYREQNFKAAVDRLKQAGAFVQRDPNIAATLGVAELKSGDQAAALEVVGRLEPKRLSTGARTGLGIALAQADLPGQAVRFLQAARDGGPGANAISYDLALCYLSLKQYAEAIRTLQEVNSNGHESADSDNLLAEAYEGNHQTQGAVGALRRAIALSPRDEDSYLEFASICIDHQDFESAAKVLSVGMDTLPHSARLLFERGILNAMQDHFEAAEKDFADSAALSPADNAAVVGLGVTFLETGDTARAIPLLRARLKDHPADANVLYLLGESLLRTGAQPGDPAFTEAQSLLEEAVRLDPRLVEPHISLGTLYLREGRLQEAVAQLERARALDPDANSAYAHLAIAYRRLGDLEKSRQVLSELKAVVDRERLGARQQVSPAAAVPSLATQPTPP